VATRAAAARPDGVRRTRTERRSAGFRVRSNQPAPFEVVEHAGQGRRPLRGGGDELPDRPALLASEARQGVDLRGGQAEIGELLVERGEQAVSDLLPDGDDGELAHAARAWSALAIMRSHSASIAS
jgi:hypothetical protein